MLSEPLWEARRRDGVAPRDGFHGGVDAADALRREGRDAA